MKNLSRPAVLPLSISALVAALWAFAGRPYLAFALRAAQQTTVPCKVTASSP